MVRLTAKSALKSKLQLNANTKSPSFTTEVERGVLFLFTHGSIQPFPGGQQ